MQRKKHQRWNLFPHTDQLHKTYKVQQEWRIKIVQNIQMLRKKAVAFV